MSRLRHELVMRVIERFAENYQIAGNNMERVSTDAFTMRFIENNFSSRDKIKEYWEVYEGLKIKR